jgi:hypothetical protein
MTWTWRLSAANGDELTTLSAPAAANQSDAESWLGEHWRDLAESGVAAVSLYDGDAKVYGPMSLSVS